MKLPRFLRILDNNNGRKKSVNRIWWLFGWVLVKGMVRKMMTQVFKISSFRMKY